MYGLRAPSGVQGRRLECTEGLDKTCQACEEVAWGSNYTGKGWLRLL